MKFADVIFILFIALAALQRKGQLA
jgi:hypothetical protein